MASMIQLAAIIILLALLNKTRLPLGVNLLIGSVILAVINIGYQIIPQAVVITFTNHTTVELIFAISMIQILGYLLVYTGRITVMLKALNSVVKNTKVLLMLIPAVIAMIPGPGVVLLSAPMVESSSSQSMDADLKAFINFWFRTSIQFAFPITFYFIVTVRLVQVEPLHLFLTFIPMSVVIFYYGYFKELRPLDLAPITVSQTETKSSPLKALFHLLKSCSFLIVIIVLILFADLNFAIVVGIALLLVVVEEKVKPEQLLSIIYKGFSWNIAILIVGVMYFTTIVEESTILNDLSSLWLASGLPVDIIFIILPFVIGITVGAYAGAAAIAFALLAPIVHELNLGITYVFLALTMNRVGCFMSPVNSSVLLTVEYFNADLLKVNKKIVSMLPVLFFTMLLTHLVGRYFH